MLAERRGDRLGVAAGGDDGVAGGQGGPGESTPMPRPAPVMSQVFVMALTVDRCTARKGVL